MIVATHSRKRFANFAVVDGDGLGHALDQIASLDLHRERTVQRIGRADLNFDGFAGAFADQQVVFALKVLHDGVVHFVAGDADRTRVNDAGEGDDGDVGGAAADIDDHVAATVR